MAWQPNKPEATDQLSVSQGDLQGNYSALDTMLTVDHYLPGVVNAGNHKQVTLPPQGSEPGSAGSTRWSLYNFAVGGNNELHVRYQDGTSIPFTKNTKSATAGLTYLPSGLIIQWGLVSSAGAVPRTVTKTYATAFPTATLHVSLTPNNELNITTDVNFIGYVNAVTAADFKFYIVKRDASGSAPPASQRFNFLAIGY